MTRISRTSSSEATGELLDMLLEAANKWSERHGPDPNTPNHLVAGIALLVHEMNTYNPKFKEAVQGCLMKNFVRRP